MTTLNPNYYDARKLSPKIKTPGRQLDFDFRYPAVPTAGSDSEGINCERQVERHFDESDELDDRTKHEY